MQKDGFTNDEKKAIKADFRTRLKKFTEELTSYISAEDGDWTVKGFIDIFKNIYTISSDTKIVSKILEIHLFPKILQFANENNYYIRLAEKQNWYPDLTFISKEDTRVKFAVDLKTTYRDFNYPGHVNGFTLGSHGTYFKDRNSTKNIQYKYSEYLAHYCLGIIYTRDDAEQIDETQVIKVKDLSGDEGPMKIGQRQVTTVENLMSITSVIKDFEFFVCEKWELASDRQGSQNTANIGSITYIDDILIGNGIFAKLGEKWFDEYWINYDVATMVKDGKSIRIRRLQDFVEFKGGDTSKINRVVTKRKAKKVKYESNNPTT